MTWREVGGALRAWRDDGQEAAVATLVDVRRSAPRSPGARFAISATGELAGSVSSGCVEGDLHQHLERMLGGASPEILHYGITDEMAIGVGLSCGGEIDVLVERHRASDPVWGRLDAAIEGSARAGLVTGLSEAILGRRMLVTRGESATGPDVAESTGTMGDDGLDALAVGAVVERLGRSEASPVRLVEGDGATEVFIETFAPPPRLVVVGATPIGAALCRFAADVGFEVVVVDPRAAFARPDRFERATEVIVEWPDAAFERLGLDSFTNVVVLTHDEKLDDPALAAALRAGCGYVGLLGGRRTQRLRRETLADQGFPPDRIAAIHGPIGLDIGARTPAEIAVAVLAELISEGRAP